MTSASARFAINLCASGGIILSSVSTRYQLGLDFQAALLTTPLSAASPHDTWESPMKAARPGSTSAANESANFAGSRSRKPSCGGKIGGAGVPGTGSLINAPTDSPL